MNIGDKENTYRNTNNTERFISKQKEILMPIHFTGYQILNYYFPHILVV